MAEERQSVSLWCEEKGRYSLRRESLDDLTDGHVRLKSLFSGVSRGTERLVLDGAVPASEHRRMQCPGQKGPFTFPLKYGYALVGEVVEGPHALVGHTVFTLHPHQSVTDVPAAALTVVPGGLPARRATLAANMETALNVVWDSGASCGDRIAVYGAGLVGLLVARLLVRMPGTHVIVSDVSRTKRAAVEAIGAQFETPDGVPGDLDIAINATSHGAVLTQALERMGPEGRLVEAGWHGARETTVALGGAFHSQRLSLVSSQVGRIPPARAPRWDCARRLSSAMELLDDPCLDVLFTHEISLDEAPGTLPYLLRDDPTALAITIRYDTV